MTGKDLQRFASCSDVFNFSFVVVVYLVFERVVVS